MDTTPFGKNFPVSSVVDELKKVFENELCAVLQAPPGAGKTTIVPLAMLNEPWMAHCKILVLAPRRLAARAAATRMADLLGEDVGRTVGYRVRMDTRISSQTRIEVITEGVLTRMLQSNSALGNVGLVIFDEFHERNLYADLGLAFCLDIQGVLNASLRLLVMSATIDGAKVANLLSHAPVVACSGRSFPVETRYVGSHLPGQSLHVVLQVVLEAAREETGSILVFLPGAAEIRRLHRHLEQASLSPEWRVVPLFGNLTAGDQRRAIMPAEPGTRKMVLATSIAETSVTIEGIRIVVDSGLQRVPRFDIRSGLTRLITEPVCRASADQRRGRAGRMEAGVCLRVWSRHANALLAAERRPEICDADLAGLALELAIWGVEDPEQLRWLDPPSKPSLSSARSLLQDLDALDHQKKITPHGRRMADLPVHPRLAHMLVAATECGQGAAACDLAALFIERDLGRYKTFVRDPDLQLRYDMVRADRSHESSFSKKAEVDRNAVRRVRRTAATLRNRLNIKRDDRATPNLGRLLAWAYPDRIAQRRSERLGHFLLSSGRGAYLDASTALASHDYIVAAKLDGNRRHARIFLATAYDRNALCDQYASKMRKQHSVVWDSVRQAVVAHRVLKFGALTVKSEPIRSPDPELIRPVMLDGIRQHGMGSLPWSKHLRRWQQRVVYIGRSEYGPPSWPDMTDAGLMADLDQWLGPYLNGVTRLKALAGTDLKAALKGMLSFEQHRELDRLAPTHLAVPSGSRIGIDYSGNQPVLAVRLQEMFGLLQTPAVADGRQPLLLHLLSPAGRPVQITQDLAGFWRTGYMAVKKELKGRYPKHHWPDDPLLAKPTSRVKTVKSKS